MAILQTSRREPANPGSIALPGLAAVLGGAALLQGAFYGRQLALVCVAAGVLAFAARIRPPAPVATALGALALGLLASALLNGMPWQSAKPFATLFFAIAAFLIARRATADDGAAAVIDTVVGVAAGVAVLGIAGVVLHRAPLALRAGSTWRLASTLTYQNAAGALFATVWAPAAVRAAGGGWWRRAAFATISVALVATQSRAAVLGALAAGAVLFVTRAASWRRLAALTLVAIIGGFAIGAFHVRIDASSDDRARVWSATLHQARNHIEFGTGPGTYRLVAPKNGRIVKTEYAHDEYLQTFSETGLFGLTCIIAAIGCCASAWWRARRSALWASVGAAAAAFLACSALDFTWRIPLLPATMFVLLATSLHPQRDDDPVADRQDRAEERVV